MINHKILKYGFLLIYLFFSLVFVLIAPLIYISNAFTFQLLSITIVFGIIINFIWRATLLSVRFDSNIKISYLDNYLFILGIGIPIIYFLVYGVPILSDDPETERLLIGSRLGFINRIWLAAIFIWGILQTLNVKKNKYLKIGIALIILIMTGFRGRPIDFILLIILSSLISGKIKLKKKGVLIFGIIMLSCGYGIYLITYLRFGGNALEMLIQRIFLINFDVNIARVFEFIQFEGPLSPSRLFLDTISVFTNSNSLQQIVTYYHNDNNLNKVMTLTHLGEIILTSKYGILISMGFSILYCAISFFIIRLFLKLVKNQNLRYIVLIYTLYFYPRVIVTGGISNAFLTKIAPVLTIIFLQIIIEILNPNKTRI